MLALASASAISVLLHTEIDFHWSASPACPCHYDDIFQHIDGLRPHAAASRSRNRIVTSGWHPVRILKGFANALKVSVNEADYYYQLIRSLRTFRYSAYVRQRYGECRNERQGRENLSVHIRRTDRYAFQKAVYRQTIYAIGIMRNTGLAKSLQYLLLPESSLRKIENRYCLRLLDHYLHATPHATYSICGDSTLEIEAFSGLIQASGIPDDRYHPAFCTRQGEVAWGLFGIRATHPRDALVDLLEMSASTHIAQSNPASTFSLVAALIGGVPIISRRPSHGFWRKMRAVLGAPPNEIETDDQTLPN
jgi:hypothetical protein